MENYEEKYKKALKVIESLYNTVRFLSSPDALLTSQTLENTFPELNESEDEKVRKALIKYLDALDDDETRYGVSFKDMRAWLEKQGEQKTEIEYIYPKFRIGDVIVQIHPNGNSQPVRVLSISKKNQSYCCESDDHNVYSSIPIRCENEYKLVEQKSAWSEEDEEMLEEVCSSIEYAETHRTTCSEKLAKSQLDWLKSLKPNNWKPSEEQLIALINSAQGLYQCKEKEVLLDLYEQLKNFES